MHEIRSRLTKKKLESLHCGEMYLENFLLFVMELFVKIVNDNSIESFIVDIWLSRKYISVGVIFINPLSANPTKWSNTLKQLFERVWPFCRLVA